MTTNEPTPFSRAIAAEVRSLVGGHGVTQQELADALGSSQNYVSIRLRGVAPFKLTDLGVIADLLRTDPEQIVAGSARWMERQEPAPDLDPIPDEINAMLSKEGRKVVRQQGRKAPRDTRKGEAETG